MIHPTPGPVALLLAVTLTTAVALSPFTVNAAQSHHTGHHGFSDAAGWAKKFDDPKRDAWQKPHEVIRALKLPSNAVIADIGAGTGYFAMRFAHMTPGGRVLAVDTEPDMVKYLGERASREGLKNVVALAAEPGNPKLPEKADLVILVDVYHHIDSREKYFRQLQQSLKPDGRIAVIDFRMDSPEGPPPAARIAPDRVKKEMLAAGYALLEEHAFLPNQYFLIFRQATR